MGMMDSLSRQGAHFQQGGQVSDLCWGTHPPICLEAPGLGAVRLRAHGRFSLQVVDPARLLRQLAPAGGGWPADLQPLMVRLRGLISGGLEQLLSREPPPLPDLARQQQPLALLLRHDLEPALAALGLAMPELTIDDLVLPEALLTLLASISAVEAAPGLQLHVLRGEQASGPLSLAQVAELRWRGELEPESLVWHADLQEWQPAATLPELAPLFRAPPPPPPLPPPLPA
jgi:hypothetical protein